MVLSSDIPKMKLRRACSHPALDENHSLNAMGSYKSHVLGLLAQPVLYSA